MPPAQHLRLPPRKCTTRPFPLNDSLVGACVLSSSLSNRASRVPLPSSLPIIEPATVLADICALGIGFVFVFVCCLCFASFL